MAATALAVSLVGSLAGCTGGAPSADSDFAIDNAKLRAMKADAGIEDCEPGSGAGSSLPDLTLPCLGGGPDVDLSSLEGPLVINLWWSGCQPCREEMPALQRFHETYGDQVALVGIDSQDNYPEAAIALADETGATYPQLADPLGDLGDTEIAPVAYPQFVFVDADGAVVGRATSGDISSLGEVVELVEDNLDVDLESRG